MEEILKQIVDKISSYNLFNNLCPGVLFCYLLKTVLGIQILTDHWFVNLILFYFAGMVISRIGSVVIEPIMKIKIKNKSLLHFSSYDDYVSASREDPMIATLSETNNTYRTLISCFLCILVLKICNAINLLCINKYFTFFQENQDWIILVLLIVLFVFSYAKQTSYVHKRVASVINKTIDESDNRS